MPDLDDPIWKELAGGYGIPCAANELIVKLQNSGSDQAFWDTFWEEMYHQGDVGVASYAVVPHLVQILSEKPEDTYENIYMYLASVEESRKYPRNPDLPDWLAKEYHSALSDALGFVKLCIPKFKSVSGSKSILCFVAQMARMENLMTLIDHIEDDTHAQTLLEKL